MKKLLTLLLIGTIFLTGCSKKEAEPVEDVDEVIEVPQPEETESEPEEVAEYPEEDFNLHVLEGELHGLLARPEDSNSVAIIIAGSGMTDANGPANIYKDLARELNANGIATLRYDKRGVGQSASAITDLEATVFEDFVDDVVGYVEKLRDEAGFEKIFLVGHSEGSLIAGVAADRTHVDGVVSISGIGTTIGDTLRRQLGEQLEPAEPLLKKLESGERIELEEIPAGYESLFHPVNQNFLITEMKYSGAEVYGKLRGITPVIIIQGENDYQITVEDAELLSAAYPEAKLVLIPKMSHVLKDAKPYSDLNAHMMIYYDEESPLNSTLIKETVEFIKGN